MVRKTIADYYFYKLICIDDNVELEYVGSTTNWKGRSSSHKSSCNNPNDKDYNSKKYKIIREYGGWNNWRMLELGRREQLSLREAQLIEEDYRREHRAKLNTNRCHTTDEEKKEQKKENDQKYYETHTEEILQYQREYRNTHKDQIAEYQKEYRETHKEEQREYAEEYRETHREEIAEQKKEYREKNPEKIALQQHNKYIKNKDIYLEKAGQKIECKVCNCMVRRSGISTHNNTPKHKKNKEIHTEK